MFDRLRSMSFEIMLSGLQVMLGGTHGFQTFMNMRMGFRHGCRRSHRRSANDWRRGRLRSGCRRRES
jgi:hypothetical protein